MIFDTEKEFSRIADIANGALSNISMTNRNMKLNFIELAGLEIEKHLEQYKIDYNYFNEQYDGMVANGVYLTGIMRYVTHPMEYPRNTIKMIKIENHRNYNLFEKNYFVIDKSDFSDIIRADKLEEVMKSFRTVIGGIKSYHFKDNVDIDLQLTLVELLMYKIELIKDILYDVSSILCKLRDDENNS